MKHLFQSYPKIPESFDALNLNEADYRLLKKTDWVVTEKIHGANFCILGNNDEACFAKRKAVLADEENFFGYHKLRDELTEKINNAFGQIKATHNDTIAVAIYGELFGGAYPHPDVAAIEGVQAIQTGIYYCPDVRFQVFDIVRITDTSSYFIDFDEMTQVCDAVALPYIPALMVGSFNEAQNYAIEFESTLATLFGLPPLPEGNLAEGIVIKPAKSVWIDTTRGWVRPVIKKKIERFSEDIYQQASKWAGKSGGSSLLGEMIQIIHGLVNENRLNNVLSKIGIVDKANSSQQAQIKAGLEADVWETFWEKHSQGYFQLKPEEQTLVNKEVALAITALLA